MVVFDNSKRAEQGKQSLLGSQFVYIGVLSNDFAAVDFREDLCYHSRPEKAKIGWLSMSKKEKFIDNGSIENFGSLMAEMLFGGKFETTDGVIYRLNSAYFIETTIESLSN